MVFTKFARRAFEELAEQGLGVAVRAAAYIVGSQTGRNFFDVELPWGRLAVPANRKKLGVGGMIFSQRDTYEPHLQPYFAACDSAFIDIGANLGYWSIFVAENMARHNISAPVIAFEPMPENFRLLQRNAGLSTRRSTIRTEQIALGASSGLISMTPSNDDPGSCFVDRTVSGSVQQMPLDEYLKTEQIGRVGLIKIDVEGYECEVLSGAQKTIVKHSPVVICEVIDSYLARNGRKPSDIFNLFASIGYAGRLAAEGGLHAEFGFVSNGDYIFSPRMN